MSSDHFIILGLQKATLKRVEHGALSCHLYMYLLVSNGIHMRMFTAFRISWIFIVNYQQLLLYM